MEKQKQKLSKEALVAFLDILIETGHIDITRKLQLIGLHRMGLIKGIRDEAIPDTDGLRKQTIILHDFVFDDKKLLEEPSKKV